MTSTVLRLSLAAGLAMLALPAAAQEATGTWNTGKARVRIADCGSGLCANIVSLSEPNDPDTGKPKTDKNNPDAGRKTRPLVGVSLLTGMKPSGDNVWKGSIYNPEDGKTYSANMTLKGSTLVVQGCALGGIICKSQTWSR